MASCLRNPYPYLSCTQTALDVTITCPACPTYITPAAAANITRCTDEAEAAKHYKYDGIAAAADIQFSVLPHSLPPTADGSPSFATSNKYVDPFYKAELKDA
jgi:hypothetical protein